MKEFFAVGENTFVICTFKEKLISRINKESEDVNNKITNNPIMHELMKWVDGSQIMIYQLLVDKIFLSAYSYQLLWEKI